MITRSNLAEQLREYQIRSKHDWASLSFFSSTSNISSSRVDVISVIWELLIFALLVFSAVSLYFSHPLQTRLPSQGAFARESFVFRAYILQYLQETIFLFGTHRKEAFIWWPCLIGYLILFEWFS